MIGITAANSQVIVGGGLGIGTKIGKSIKDNNVIIDKDANDLKVSFSPKVGYMFLDGKMEVGAAIDVNYSHNTTFMVVKNDPKKDYRSYQVGLSVDPYVRYFFLKKNFFGLGIQGDLNLGGYFNVAGKYFAIDDIRTESQAKEANDLLKEEIKKEKAINLEWGLYVKPVMMFDITERCYVDVTLDALGLGLGGTRRQYADVNGTNIVTNNFKAGLAFNNTRSAIKVGFAYKF